MTYETGADIIARIGAISTQDLDRLSRKMRDMKLIHSCITCIHFDASTEGCELASGTRPPAEVIALGCPQWADLPF